MSIIVILFVDDNAYNNIDNNIDNNSNKDEHNTHTISY